MRSVEEWLGKITESLCGQLAGTSAGHRQEHRIEMVRQIQAEARRDALEEAAALVEILLPDGRINFDDAVAALIPARIRALAAKERP